NLSMYGANITLGDSSGVSDDRIVLGDDSDLLIYHNNPNSFIRDQGNGNFFITTDGNYIFLAKDDLTNMATFQVDGPVELYHSGSPKLATTSTGIDVTGTASADELNSKNGKLFLDDNGSHNGVINAPASLFINFDSDNTSASESIVFGYDRDGTSGGTSVATINSTGIDVTGTVTADAASLNNDAASFSISSADLTRYQRFRRNANNSLILDKYNGSTTTNTAKFDENGDISFYDSLGSSQSFFWDASAESL
ncbi:MAG: hypothetical protein ACPHUD_11045, partial [Porticoccaceae bacterium]